MPSVEQPIQDAPKIRKVPSPINDPVALSTMNTQNPSAGIPTNAANNRRELPNVPRPTTNSDSKPSTTANQNPFYNQSTNNASGISSSRSTPSQWMENIGQSIRRQTSNIVDVSLKESSFFSFIDRYSGFREVNQRIKMNQKIRWRI